MTSGRSELVQGTDRSLRVRLQSAALELFREQGYEKTTAAQIGARVGVTARTFFRQFPDKREVLFEGEAVLRAALTTAIAEAPEALGPIETLFHAFRSTVALLEGNRAFSVPRHEVIAATPALAEREVAKHATLAEALSDALQARGVDNLRADLAARAGMAAYIRATHDWIHYPVPALGERLDGTLRELRALFV